VPGYDLHSHTDASDGTTSIEENVADAIALGLEGLGVTDHDTTGTWDRARKAAESTGLEVVPGAELSAELDGFSVHVLGYWFDPEDAALSVEMDRVRNERTRRAEEIVDRFRDEVGIPVTFARVRELAGDAPIGRPHIAQAVVEHGAAEDVTEVFERWLHDGGPAYVPKYAVDPVRCVELIVAAGGVAVLAHPGLYGPPEGGGLTDAVIDQMVTAGLAGIEADHPDHDEGTRAHFRGLAARLGLVMTAGSDYHGDRKDLVLGEATTPRERVEALRERRRERA
jgi:3',5'-nucleoside bisphosphate phosphatase